MPTIFGDNIIYFSVDIFINFSKISDNNYIYGGFDENREYSI